jgi:hypothetical protein
MYIETQNGSKTEIQEVERIKLLEENKHESGFLNITPKAESISEKN